jgi:polysaccharide export outer membrane protein
MHRLIVIFLICAATRVFAQIPTPLPPLPNMGEPAAPAASAPTPAAANPNPPPGFINGYVPDATYKLRVGDAISFQILEDRIWDPQNLPKRLLVEDSGETDVPYIGRVMAVGKTCKQLGDEIKAALEKDYYKQASVIISLNVANRILGRVYVWGQVHNQGALEIQVNENLTAGQAILRAQGFADFADKKNVKVVRAAPDANGQRQTIDLNMKEILDEGKPDKDIVLQPGDLVIVPSRLINF